VDFCETALAASHTGLDEIVEGNQEVQVPIHFEHLSSPELEQAARRGALIVLPVGQLEEHGPHLPVETDCIIARKVAYAAADAVDGEIPVLTLPVVWTGYSVRQVAHFPGLVGFREPETMIQLIYDMLYSLVESGFRKIIIINAHGNNPAILELACRRIGSDLNVFPAVANVWSFSKRVGPQVRQSAMGGCGGHADEFETSLLLHLAPELVHMERATAEDIINYRNRFFPGDLYSDIPNVVGGIFWSTWGVVPTKTGVYGDPTPATAETGRILFEAIVSGCADFMREYYTRTSSQGQ